jgi:hypothetical protein
MMVFLFCTRTGATRRGEGAVCVSGDVAARAAGSAVCACGDPMAMRDG